METKRNEKVAYEAPAIETVELVVEGAVLSDSGVGGSGSLDGSDSDEM